MTHPPAKVFQFQVPKLKGEIRRQAWGKCWNVDYVLPSDSLNPNSTSGSREKENEYAKLLNQHADLHNQF